MGDQEDQLQQEWRQIVISKLNSLEGKVEETQKLVLKVDIEKLDELEKRVRIVENNQTRFAAIILFIQFLFFAAVAVIPFFLK